MSNVMGYSLLQLLPLEIVKIAIIASIIWLYAVLTIQMVKAALEVIFAKD